MVKANVLVAISQRVAELDAQVAKSKAEEKSVGRIKRQTRALKVIADLIQLYAPDEFMLTGLLNGELEAMINPSKGQKMVFEMKEGDSILDLLDRYEHVKDAYKRILAQADSMGLKLVGSTLVKK